MDNLVACALLPHPPIMIPEVGKEELAKITATVSAVKAAAERIKEHNPQTIVLITPHGPVFQDAVSISIHPRLKGNLAAFGVPEVNLGFETDGLLIKQIIRKAERLGVNLLELTDEVAKNYRLSLSLDHGALVPLYYLHQAGFKGQLVHLSIGMLPYEEMYTFGKAVQAAIGIIDKKVAVIASGDLSHRLVPDAPAGYSPRGQEFDQKLLAAMEHLDIKSLLGMERTLIEEAGECGLRPAVFLLGVLGGLSAKAEVLSYEGPFGVGYGVVIAELNNAKAKQKKARQKISEPAQLARQSLEYYLEHHELMAVPEKLSPLLSGRAGVFVSLKKGGRLRGCIGTFLSTEATIAEEVIHNAVKAATKDPRFTPVVTEELTGIDISVDILSEPEGISSIEELDPARYGVIVKKGMRTGLLLPMLEGVNTVEEQLSIAKEKAGIRSEEQAEVYRFTVTRYQ
ncbi:MAG: AmmeMemoRadiSam system protein A [Pelosinus sp.]|nr:AmmeMemoRadiSam system protein A [Pelosinus sp.]